MRNFLIPLLSIFFLTACQEDIFTPSENPDTPPISSTSEIEKGELVLGSIYGIVVNEREEPLSNVLVRIENESITTNEQGNFLLQDIPMFDEHTVVSFSSSGYFNTTRIVKGDEENSNFLAVKLQTEERLGAISATDGGSINNDNVEIEFPAGSIENYDGQVEVVVSYIDPTSIDFPSITPNLDAINIDNQ